jgi:hypothetical protein
MLLAAHDDGVDGFIDDKSEARRQYGRRENKETEIYSSEQFTILSAPEVIIPISSSLFAAAARTAYNISAPPPFAYKKT